MSAVEKFEKVFNSSKPILAMIHLKGDAKEETLALAKYEIGCYMENGIDGIIVENYFGTEDDVEIVLDYIQKNCSDIVYGVNILDNDEKGFAVAAKYGAKFIQLDSVAGHLIEEDDMVFDQLMREWRSTTNAIVLGGVRFKYQPYNSGRSLEEDLKIAMTRCDAIVVTGDGTGMTTDMNKIKKFREIIGDFPLIVGAGMTPENCAERLAISNGAIVGSYLKDNYKDIGDVNADHVRSFMKVAYANR